MAVFFHDAITYQTQGFYASIEVFEQTEIKYTNELGLYVLLLLIFEVFL